MINRVGLLQATLPTFLSFLHSHTFRDGILGMIWDANSYKMEEPNVDERKQATGFHIGTTIVQGIFEGAHRRILGQVMDLTYFTWIFNLCWAKQVQFA
jgi:hypothetical protein